MFQYLGTLLIYTDWPMSSWWLQMSLYQIVLGLSVTSIFNKTHNRNVIMSAMASQITSISLVCSTVCSGADQRIHQSSASLVQIKENTKVLRHWLFWGENPLVTGGFSSQKTSNTENVSIWLCYQESHESYYITHPRWIGFLALTHLSGDKNADFSQTTSLSTFSWEKMIEFYWNFIEISLSVQWIISQHWFR